MKKKTSKRVKIETTPYDPADYLETPKDCAAYLEAAMEEAPGDVAFFASALGDVARSKGMTKIAKAAGVSPETLYRSLSADGNPGLQTVFRVLDFLGIRFAVKAA